jgi:hypothetical protein
MNTLEKLFGSAAQVKIMRLFMFNQKLVLNSAEVAKRTKVRSASVRTVMSTLEKVGLVKKKSFSKKVSVTVGRGKKQKKVARAKKMKGWMLNESFVYLTPLRNLLMPSDALSNREIEKKISVVGRVKLIILSGVFIHEPDARVDLVIVGDQLKSDKIRSIVGDLEARVGSELAYAALDTDEFKYRHNINDKLIRDILDFPHEKIVNKLGL